MTPALFCQGFAAQRCAVDPIACVPMVDGWIEHRTGRSPVAISGQTWADASDAEWLLGLRSLPIRMARAMRAAGFAPTTEPQEGDVAAIVAGTIMTCAVRVGAMWVFCSGNSLCAVADARVLMAWRVA
ncbi:MAG: hypothetical protein DI629_12060 [Mesorhizobium amorphae]|nr:MAG: hypothetical protein DI629_12060 [Mesorhizobium amorphae]